MDTPSSSVSSSVFLPSWMRLPVCFSLSVALSSLSRCAALVAAPPAVSPSSARDSSSSRAASTSISAADAFFTVFFNAPRFAL